VASRKTPRSLVLALFLSTEIAASDFMVYMFPPQVWGGCVLLSLPFLFLFGPRLVSLSETNLAFPQTLWGKFQRLPPQSDRPWTLGKIQTTALRAPPPPLSVFQHGGLLKASEDMGLCLVGLWLSITQRPKTLVFIPLNSTILNTFFVGVILSWSHFSNCDGSPRLFFWWSSLRS